MKVRIFINMQNSFFVVPKYALNRSTYNCIVKMLFQLFPILLIFKAKM